MKLKTFSQDNLTAHSVIKTTPSVGVNIKTGLFNFNRAACDLIGLKDNDQIIFHQDEDKPEDWYLEKLNGNGGGGKKAFHSGPKARSRPVSCSTMYLFPN